MHRSNRLHIPKPTLLLLSAVTLAACVLMVADIEPAKAADAARSGERVFKQACFACHGTGLNGAPVVGDQYEWEDRLKKGASVLFENTLKGMNNMPPRGACVGCSDAEIAAAVRYLIDS